MRATEEPGKPTFLTLTFLVGAVKLLDYFSKNFEAGQVPRHKDIRTPETWQSERHSIDPYTEPSLIMAFRKRVCFCMSFKYLLSSVPAFARMILNNACFSL